MIKNRDAHIVPVHNKNVVAQLFILKNRNAFNQSLFMFIVVPLLNISVVEGKAIELPCNTTAPVYDDTLDMVFWFKDGTGPPFYS